MITDWISQTRNRLAQQRTQKPATKAGQIRSLWPEIHAALDAGHSISSVRHWLFEEAGIELSVASFRSYISRNRRQQAAREKAAAEVTLRRAVNVKQPQAPPAVTTSEAPINGALRALKRASRFDIRTLHGDGDPAGKHLI